MSFLSSFQSVLLCAVALRFFLIYFGEAFAPVGTKYTDIDYVVFSDAARHVYNGGSAFERAEYRYTPILAWMLQPNIWWRPEFGKLLFSAFDIVCALLMRSVMRLTAEDMFGSRQTKDAVIGSATHWIAVLWLFNPITATVSTRGSCDSLIAFLVLATLHSAMTDRLYLAALLFGLCVHFRIYPVIYALALFMYVSRFRTVRKKQMAKKRKSKKDTISSNNNNNSLFAPLRFALGDPKCWLFGFCSLTWFLGFNALAYHMSFDSEGGNAYIDEAWLYHLKRADIQHSFSPYFYVVKMAPTLSHVSSVPTFICWFLGKFSFVPQFGSAVYISLKFHPSLALVCFANTLVFVSLNKVCTSQYFIWYICLLPTVLPFTVDWTKLPADFQLSLLSAISKWSSQPPEMQRWMTAFGKCSVLWFAANGNWLFWAYRYEIQGHSNELILVWFSSLLFLAVNIAILRAVLNSHKHAMAALKQD